MATPEEKNRLTSGYLTHELRAPLASIRFALDLFLERAGGTLRPEERRLIDIAVRNSGKLNLLIDDIMELSKIQTGKLPAKTEPVDPSELARETVFEMSPWAEKAGVRLDLSACVSCPPVLADRRRTAQALTNLISNALKFTPRGGAVRVSVGAAADRPGFVLFSVSDDGCGIRKEDQRKIFGYFVQAGPEDKRREGTGLGLPLARAMVELQGGLMWVESEPGRGSRFSFTLPAAGGERCP